MNRKILTLLITSFFSVGAAFADYSFVDSRDFTGDAFFSPSTIENSTDESSVKEQEQSQQNSQLKQTMPPIKKARLQIKNKMYERKMKNSQMAPTDPNDSIYNSDADTSDFVSKEPEEHFDEDIMPDGFEADEESVEEQKRAKLFKHNSKKEKASRAEDTEDIVLDCDNVDYDTDKYCIYATGNVSVLFVKQQTTIKADVITYDRMNNTIKAEGNVKILKRGQTVTGDYIFVDMNEENALIENPVTETSTVVMRAKKGYLYGDRIVQENGTMTVDKPFPIYFMSANSGPQFSRMLTKKEDSLQNNIDKGLIKIDAKTIKITEKGEHEILTLKRANIYKGQKKIIKIPSISFYTNKNMDYIESSFWEIGSFRGLGAYAGPGFVFRLPKGSVLKAAPLLNYNSGFGVGALGRLNTGTNTTQVAYGTAGGKVLVRGRQALDDRLFLQYAMNDYVEEWFLGKRRPKYGVNLVYNNSYSSKDFLLKGRTSSFSHRIDAGYFHDIDRDKHYKALKSSNIGTTRFKYMAAVSQNLFEYKDEEKLKAFSIGINGQLSAALYGTGDTQFIGRIGPYMHTQYKRWMQDVGYYETVYDDHTPLVAFDTFRYGRSSLYVRETFKLTRLLGFSWFTTVTLSGDSPNNKLFQENSFYITFGPDDFKLNLGYDLIRDTAMCTVEVMIDAKGTRVDYDKLVIKQDKKSQAKKKDPVDLQAESEFKNSDKAPVLQRAVVEDIKTVEDVL